MFMRMVTRTGAYIIGAWMGLHLMQRLVGRPQPPPEEPSVLFI